MKYNKNLIVTVFVIIMLSMNIVVGMPAETEHKNDEDNKVVTEKTITSIKTEHNISFGTKARANNEQDTSSRSQILDSIFNIPIATLKAVNELVQSIAGNLQAAGSGTYFSKTEKIRHQHPEISHE